MKSLILIILIAILPFTGNAQQTLNGSIIHDGLEREYILYIPEIYSPDMAVPLIMNFHGYGSNAFEQMLYGDFRPIADTVGFLVVHPLGTEDAFGNRHWNVGWGASTVDDVGFTAALIDSLALDYNIDPEKIYSTGMSNGGFMSYHLACNLSNKIAAIASVTGTMNIGVPASCTAGHPFPVMEIHGTADPVVPYDGTEVFESIINVLRHWVGFNNCDTIPVITNMPDIDTTDGSTVEYQLFSGGDNGVEVQHYKIINGAHTWPGTNFGSPGTNYDINASVEIWKFFRRFDINGLINITDIGNAGRLLEDVSIYPVPASKELIIAYNDINSLKYNIYNISADKVLSGQLTQSPEIINIQDLPEGFYIMKIGHQTYKFFKMR